MKKLECQLRSLQVTRFYLLTHSFRHSLEAGIPDRRLDKESNQERMIA